MTRSHRVGAITQAERFFATPRGVRGFPVRPMRARENRPFGTGTRRAKVATAASATTMPLTSAYWSNRGAPRGGPAVKSAHAPAPGFVLPAVPSSEDAAASLGEIQAALLQPGGGLIQQRRTPVVDAGDAYKPGYEGVVAHAKASSSSRLTRIQQVREQEKLWARFQAREFRAAVKDHHVELTNQLHQGWLKARALKQQELERDYTGAIAGVGRAQRDAAALGDATDKKRRAREKAAQKLDADLSALERHETALGKEFERLDRVEAPYFAAADRRVRATALADETREDMRAKAAAFADSEESRRRKFVERLIAETDARVARPTRGGRKMAAATFKDTHFNDLVVDRATGVAVGVRRACKGAGAADTRRLALAPAAAAAETEGVASVERAGGGGKKPPLSAFDAAFERERTRAERRDDELKTLRAKKAAEASRANVAARRARAVVSKREMAAKMDAEARADRARKVREMAEGGGLVNAPLLRKWNETKKTEDTLRAFETAFSAISGAGGSSGGGGGGGGSGGGGGDAPFAGTFDDEKPFDEEDAAPSSSPGGGFDTLFEASEEERRLEDLGLENVLAMARGAQTPVEERRSYGVPEALARRGVAGATASEIAAVVSAGKRGVPSPRRPYDTRVVGDAVSDDDDDFVGPAGGAGLPPSSFVDEAQLDAAVAAAAERGRRAALAAASPGDAVDAASASAARLSALARGLDADTSELTGSRSLNLSEDTTHLFSNTVDDVTETTEADASAAAGVDGVAAPAPSTLPGSSSSGDAEAEMRASLAATATAMDRVTREAEAAEANLAAAAARAAAQPASAFDPGAGSDLPERVEVPALKPLDAILGELGEQMRVLDAAAAEASAPAPESKYTSSSSGGGSSGGVGVPDASAARDDSALYAAAAAAANNSAPPSSQTFGDVSTHGAPSTPGDGAWASPAGAPAATPQSADAPPYGLRPQRDARGGYGSERGGDVVDVAAVAARIAAAAVADAAPGEAPDATARRVASAMEAALGGTFAKREPAPGISSASPSDGPRPGGETSRESANPDSSWAQALGALEGEWAASLNISRAPDGADETTRGPSPSRFAGVASRDADAAFAAAEAAAEAAALAETRLESGRRDSIERDSTDSTATRSIAAPLRVGARSDWRAEPFADDWSDTPTAGSRDDRRGGLGGDAFGTDAPSGAATAPVGGFQVDGRSLAALANALDERSFDDAFDDASSFGEPEVSLASGDDAAAAALPESFAPASLRRKPSKEEEAKAASRRAEAAALRKKARDADKKHRDALTRKAAAKRVETSKKARASAGPGSAAKASRRR